MHSPAEWAAIGVGVLLIVSGVLWRHLHLRSKRRAQHAGLDDPDPAVRAATIDSMTVGGLATHAATLEGVIETEQDPLVLDAVAAAVFRNQWEPASMPAMIQLRIWASNRTRPAVAEPPLSRPEETLPERPSVGSVAPAARADAARPEPEVEPGELGTPLPGGEPAFGDPLTGAPQPGSFEPASPELVAASEPVAEAIARALGTTVRSLRVTTLEGVVTAQWPR